MKLEKYSFGIGDRFTMEGEAQLKAIQMASEAGIPFVPVWNKSNREHQIVHTLPSQTRKEADEAVKNLGWKGSYYVDADHINMNNVDGFIADSDFFTIDVADYIGKPAPEAEKVKMLSVMNKYQGNLLIPGIDRPFVISTDLLEHIAGKFLFAVLEAARIYQHIAAVKGNGNFIPEVSMDEVEEAQSPVELFFILLMLNEVKVPVQTIAPKFTGRFNKGVDYVGDKDLFTREFEEDLLVIDFAVKQFNLPDNLKLSVHSGSDKFTIYPVMGELIRKHDKGIHVKTAGTTWLEEVIGLAMAGGAALQMAKDIYTRALEREKELCAPYATVINIDPAKLPSAAEVAGWSSEKFANSLRHIPGHPDYNLHFRQLIHVGYKVASELGDQYREMITKNKNIVGEQVTVNIYERHILRLWGKA